MSVIKTINTLKNTSSRNEKKKILRANSNDDLLKKTFELVLNPFCNFYITKVPSLPSDFDMSILNTDIDITEEIVIEFAYQEAFGSIDRKKFKEGIAAIDYLCNDQQVKDLIRKIISKDLDCGVGASTVNSVWEGLIPEYKLMKAEEKKHLNQIEYPAMVDEKIDGVRCTAFVTPSGEVEIKSSSGRTFLSLDHIADEISLFYDKISNSYYDGCILDGELISVDENEMFIGREKSNGLAYRALLGTASKEEKESFRFVCFDLLSSARQIEQGFDSKKLIARIEPFIYLDGFKYLREVDSILAEDEAMVTSFFEQVVKKGGEGVVVKSCDSPYQSKRSKHWVKLKKEYTADVIITDAYPHTKKEGHLGGMTIESSDGEVVGNIGTKLTDAMRKKMWGMHENGDLVGNIATVTFMELTTKEGKKSFYLPRFIELRFDKKEADDLDKIEAMM